MPRYKYSSDRITLRSGERWVADHGRQFAFEIAMQHPNVRSALDKIADDLTKNGLLFMQDKQVLRVSFPFEEQIKKDWIPCMRSAVFTIAAQGVLPLYTYLDKRTGEYRTVCPQHETYRLSVRYEKGEPIIRFWWRNTIPDKPPYIDYVDPKVEIISGFGYDPWRDGSLNSLVSTLFPTVNFIDSMLEYATRAEDKNSDPTMIVQEELPKAANMEDANANVPYNFFIDSDPCEDREEDKYDLQELQARLSRHEIGAEIDAVAEQKSSLGILQRVITASLLNRIKLQPGQSVGTQLMPRPRSDLVNLINISKETVSQVFKIPQEVLSGAVNARTAEGTASLMVSQYRETLRTWARFLDPIVTSIYRRMYQSHDKRQFNRLVAPTLKNMLPNLVDKLSNIRVIINFSQGLTTQELEHAVNRGILDYRLMAQFWLIQHGLPKELLHREDDILSDQLKRDILLGRAGQTKRPRQQQQEERDEDGGRKRRRGKDSSDGDDDISRDGKSKSDKQEAQEAKRRKKSEKDAEQ